MSPSVLQVIGWRAEGLRCPDHEICFEDERGEPHQISLIQMPNGTGKTTTLALLRAALSGSADQGHWDGARMYEFRKRGSDRPNGTFEVRLRLNEHRVTIIMIFDFESKRVHYKTTRSHGQVEEFDPPFEFRKFMNDAFINFFVFDGELAETLLDRRHVHAEQAVENLFQLNMLRSLQGKVAEHWDKLTRSAGATEEKGLTRRRARRDSLRQHLAHITKKKRQLESEHGDLLSQLARLEESYSQEIDKVHSRGEKLNDLKAKLGEVRHKVRIEALEGLDAMRSPDALSSSFAADLHALKVGLDRVKLPESAAREFFQELADEDECVCGRPINEHTRSLILERAHQYLGSDDIALLNAMKTAIDDAVGESREAAEDGLRVRLQLLGDAVDEERDLRNAIDQLQHEAEQEDPAVQEAGNEIRNIEQRIAHVIDELDKFSGKDHHLKDDSHDVEFIEKLLEKAENDLAEITRTLDLKKKRDSLSSIVDSAYAKAREGILDEVRNQANERIEQMMPYNSIRIQKIERCLALEGQEGGSAGETLSVAYAFLATLFNRSEHQLPFVVDSPAGPIDLAVRPRIGELIPRLTRQFIAFTISSERDRFIPMLKESCKGEVQFVTLFRSRSADVAEEARSAPGFSETADGLVVPGEAFFNNFQLDTEEVS